MTIRRPDEATHAATTAAAPPRVLIVDDDPNMGSMLVDSLKRKRFAPVFTSSGDEALALLEAQDIAAVVTDLRMKGLNGLELCERIVANRPDVPVIVVTAFGSMETAIAAIRAGAEDFVTKPFDVDVLALALERAVRTRALRDEVKRLRRVADDAVGRFGDLVGASPAMKKVYDLLDRLGDSDATVLITGESGTGKELVAQAIHARSRRGGYTGGGATPSQPPGGGGTAARTPGPFVAVNCAAMPEALLESELFGHVKGAFTDARAARKGLFVQATGGTIFLDEIGEMPVALQPKLLRALQERAARPVGGDSEVKFDARVIAATNRDLETAVEEKRFREDLYYRLNVVHVELPSLRARGNDVLLLAQKFLDRFAAQSGKKVTALSPEAAERLLAYSWPGNVRELQNAIERAVALTRYEQLAVDDLPEKIRNYKRSHVLLAADDPAELVPMDEVERRYVLRVMEAVGGNKSLAAQVLGFDRKTLYRKLEKYGYEGGSGAGGDR